MATTLYGTEDGIIDRWSQAGVDLRTDDNPPANLGRAIQRASQRINRYCLLLYSDAQLAASDWVLEAADDLGAYFLGGRRGNPVPTSIVEYYDMVMDDLKKLHKGQAWLPDAAPRRAVVPRLSNINMRLWPTPHSRVQEKRSTGRPQDYSQRKDRLDLLRYLPSVDF